MNREEISLKIDEIDREIMAMSETLNGLGTEKHNKTVEMENLKEGIRQQKILIKKKRTEKEILQREYWRA